MRAEGFLHGAGGAARADDASMTGSGDVRKRAVGRCYLGVVGLFVVIATVIVSQFMLNTITGG